VPASEHPRPRRPRYLRFLLWAPVLTLSLLLGGGWLFGPALIAPVDNFEQGPGAAIAYVSLARQFAAQTTEFWNGADVTLTVNQSEFSGLIASALLSGRTQENPLRKVRADLNAGQMQIELVLRINSLRVPERFRGPIGLELWLQPQVTTDGQVRFQITSAALGRIPVPVRVIQWAGRTLQEQTPGFSAADAAIEVPLGDMVSSQWNRAIHLTQFTIEDSQLILVGSMKTETQQ
jgi:uncharacterized protein YpmS